MTSTLQPHRPGTPLSKVGGLPPIRPEFQAARALTVVANPKSPVEMTAAPAPKSATPAQLDYLATVGNLSPSLAAVLRPQAAYRWLLPYLAAITPQYVETILRGALAGNHVQAWELFDLMIDSNPEIAACIGEYVDGISEKKIIIEPYHEEDEQPTPNAIRNQKMVSAALRNMNPDPANDENALRATVRDILFSRFHGQSVIEEDWYDTYGTGQLNRLQVNGVGNIVAPRCTFWVHPVCYAWDMNGRLGLRAALKNQLSEISQTLKNSKPGERNLVEPPVWNFISSQPMPSYLVDFPKNKFLISVFKSKSGTALSASCLRPLAAWWVFENFSADWSMDLAQIFNIPFRTATFSPNTSEPDKAFVREMLQNMGSRGWAMLPEGVTLQFEKAMASGAETPASFLIKLCHEQYRKVILRQTMTGSGHGGASSGSKAGMGEEKNVKEQCFNAGAQFTCEVLREQMARHIQLVNTGDDSELPFIHMMEEDEGGLEDAQRDQTLSAAGLKIGEKYLRKKYNIPVPLPGEPTIGGQAPPAPTAPADAGKVPPPSGGSPNGGANTDKEINAELTAAAETIEHPPLVHAAAQSLAEMAAPLVKYLNAGLDITDEAAQRAYFERAIAKWPELTKPLQHDKSFSETVTPALVKTFTENLTAKEKSK